MISSCVAPRPSQYALRRLESFEYLELWYLTQEGCVDAAQHQHTQNDDTFGLTKVDDVVALRQVSGLRASKNVVPDINLSFRQMSITKTILIQQMTRYQWPNEAVGALANFFTQIEAHSFRLREFGEQALLTYQARVRQNWHDSLKQNTAFDIALFNEELLQSIYREVVNKAHVQSLNEVSFPPLLYFISGAHICPPSPIPLSPTMFLCDATLPLRYRHYAIPIHHAIYATMLKPSQMLYKKKKKIPTICYHILATLLRNSIANAMLYPLCYTFLSTLLP